VHARSAAFALSGLVNLKIPPHLESVVEVNRDEAEVWGRRRHSVDQSTMRLRFGQLKGTPLKENRFYRSRARPRGRRAAAIGSSNGVRQPLLATGMPWRRFPVMGHALAPIETAVLLGRPLPRVAPSLKVALGPLR
jgi:hypothetical protein